MCMLSWAYIYCMVITYLWIIHAIVLYGHYHIAVILESPSKRHIDDHDNDRNHILCRQPFNVRVKVCAIGLSVVGYIVLLSAGLKSPSYSDGPQPVTAPQPAAGLHGRGCRLPDAHHLYLHDPCCIQPLHLTGLYRLLPPRNLPLLRGA